MFPSPIGVLFFQIIRSDSCRIAYWFPSPIGVLFFQIRKAVNYERIQNIVSVPYRGSIFPNYELVKMDDYLDEFPSPIGVLFFQILLYVSIKSCQISFRPLSGFYFSKWKKVELKASGIPVSVPYRGSIFPNPKTEQPKTEQPKTFPSPIGVLFFQI